MLNKDTVFGKFLFVILPNEHIITHLPTQGIPFRKMIILFKVLVTEYKTI